MPSLTLKKFTLLSSFLAFVIASRLIPHWPGFTAVGASALLLGAIGGFSFVTILGIVLPLVLTDLIFGFHETLIPVYGAFAFNILIGALMINANKQGRIYGRVIGSAVLASISFFVISNFGVWMLSPIYSRTLNGLVTCFALAVPFFHYELLGNLFFSAILFGTYRVLAASPQFGSAIRTR